MRLRPCLRVGLLALAWIGMAAPAGADVELASIFGDAMVLQRGLPVPVWGWADPGEDVSVSFAGQTRKTLADKEGRWQIKLDSLKTNSDGQL